MCKKRTFQTEIDARQFLNYVHAKASKTKQTNKAPQDVYRCPECGRWHLTSQVRRITWDVRPRRNLSKPL